MALGLDALANKDVKENPHHAQLKKHFESIVDKEKKKIEMLPPKKPTSAIELLAVAIDLLNGKKGDAGEKGAPGERGERGGEGAAGKDGKDGVPGKDGINGKDGKNGKDGAPGKDGKDGKPGPKGEPGKNGKDAPEITQETILEIATPIIIKNVQKSVASKTVSANEVDGLADFVTENSGSAATFETVSKNLDASGATLSYTGDNLTSIAYVNGITKTLNYTGDSLTSVVLSGSTPAGIDLTKTLSYTGDNLTGVVYT